MITESELRKALKATDVSDALDLIVRRELNAGMTNLTIYNEIASLMDTAEKWEEYREEAREDLNGTLDALAGSCHPDSRYPNRKVTHAAWSKTARSTFSSPTTPASS